MKKLLIVVEKPMVAKWVGEFLESHLDILNGREYCFDYTGPVHDTRTSNIPFYRHGDGWYLYGEPSEFEDLVLPDLDLPEHAYIALKSGDNIFAEQFREKIFDASEIDEVWFLAEGVGLCEDYSEDEVFAAKKYLEYTGISVEKCKFFGAWDFSDEKHVRDSFGHMLSFKDVYGYTKKRCLENGFACFNDMPNPFQRVLTLAHMSMKDFCEYFHIKRRTVENWKYGKSECPEWALELMEYKLLKEGII